ncbi:MAG: GGDEF domain-containing protein [Pseudomonadota bacterium]
MGRHVLLFAISHVLGATGFLITHLLPADTPYLFHLTQAFYFLASAILLFAVCERAGQKLPVRSVAVVYVICAAVLALAVHLSDDVAPRLIIVNTGYGVLFAMGVTTLLAGPRRGMIDKAIIAVMAIQAIDFLVRPNVTLLFESSIPAEAYKNSVYYSVIGLALGVKNVILAMVLIGASVVEWLTALRESSERDPLTGLSNRASFENAMRNLLPQAQNEGRALSLVVADIDHFKQVNDIWGHQVGDVAISGFGQLIGNMVRECDSAGRIGGEEFCIAVWDCENDAAERLAERIRKAFARLEHPGLTEDIRLTASFGLATAREGESYERLFARADAALYRAKSSGRNRVMNAELWHPDDEAAPAPNPELIELRRAGADPQGSARPTSASAKGDLATG